MKDKIRVMVQMRHTPDLGAAAKASAAISTAVPGIAAVAGFSLDEKFNPVKVPQRQARSDIGETDVGSLHSFVTTPEQSTYLVRGEVENQESLEQLRDAVFQDPNAVEVYSDPRISAIATCPSAPVGTHDDVASLLQVGELQARGMDGSNVMVAIVDTGVNMEYLNSKGKTPQFDLNKSWTPVAGVTPGSTPVDHGTMCAFDVCVSAPNSTLLDYALLLSQAQGETAMDGFLSDAVAGYGKLLDILLAAADPKPALVVNNSWGMFHPSWDFPVGNPGNYSDNPEHPFNIIVESLEDAGADILFAAGNCGPECPDSRCENVTERPIYGANSHASVTCVAGITIENVRVGYSSRGPGHLQAEKPDLCTYTHFRGSEVYPDKVDGGTSAACPVATGVVAAIRSVYGPDVLPPAQLRNLLRRSANDLGSIGFDYGHGYGAIDVVGLLNSLDRKEIRNLPIGQALPGNLKESGASMMFKVTVGDALNIELDGPQNVDFDIYVRKGAEPTVNDYDYRGYTGSASEKIRIQPVEQGEYYVMVRSYRGAGDFVVRSRID